MQRFLFHRACVADAEDLSAIACGSVDVLTCANGLMFLPSHERCECTNLNLPGPCFSVKYSSLHGL